MCTLDLLGCGAPRLAHRAEALLDALGPLSRPEGLVRLGEAWPAKGVKHAEERVLNQALVRGGHSTQLKAQSRDTGDVNGRRLDQVGNEAPLVGKPLERGEDGELSPLRTDIPQGLQGGARVVATQLPIDSGRLSRWLGGGGGSGGGGGGRGVGGGGPCRHLFLLLDHHVNHVAVLHVQLRQRGRGCGWAWLGDGAGRVWLGRCAARITPPAVQTRMQS